MLVKDRHNAGGHVNLAQPVIACEFIMQPWRERGQVSMARVIQHHTADYRGPSWSDKCDPGQTKWSLYV